ncbi:hypothetical protein CM50_07450 [Bacillus subtilis]|nr:hypothetical protein CM50_07450 [Bacillus subtilis] [Bacillus stercoris]
MNEPIKAKGWLFVPVYSGNAVWTEIVLPEVNSSVEQIKREFESERPSYWKGACRFIIKCFHQ